jgi:Radical SAM superfamily/4Fe-4S single cluster domain
MLEIKAHAQEDKATQPCLSRPALKSDGRSSGSKESVRALIARYTEDPMIGEMWRAVREFGPLRSISIDVTKRCNLRCAGCYFFTEKMDAVDEASDDYFDEFTDAEVQRGTNFITVLGGEPSLVPERLKRLARNFRLMVVTNGIRPIPCDGLENAAIAISVWGDRKNDRKLRGLDKIDIFDRALSNYRSDPRVGWYITLPPRPSSETEEVVEACVANGHFVGFNYYGDLESIGGDFDHRNGFELARRFVDRMIERFSDSVVSTRYLNAVVSTGMMQGVRWGYDVCASISADNPMNAGRKANGNPYSPHFRAYNPDLKTTRRCCVGQERDCSSCYDVWAHMSWISLNLPRHLNSADDFLKWMAIVYTFYGVSRLVDPVRFRSLLPLIHARLST